MQQLAEWLLVECSEVSVRASGVGTRSGSDATVGGCGRHEPSPAGSDRPTELAVDPVQIDTSSAGSFAEGKQRTANATGAQGATQHALFIAHAFMPQSLQTQEQENFEKKMTC